MQQTLSNVETCSKFMFLFTLIYAMQSYINCALGIPHLSALCLHTTSPCREQYSVTKEDS